MIILGLGTNLGDRFSHLRKALDYIKKIPTLVVKQVSPLYLSDALLPENAPVEWDIAYINLALRCEAKLSPQELLMHVKKIEVLVGRKPEERWGPRIIDIDILAWDNLIQYDDKLHIPHKSLTERPFALWPLTDVAPRWIYPFAGDFQGKTAAEISARWGSRFSGEAPFHTRQIAQRIDAPQLVGILNVTPDSFSDGGNFINPEAALQHIHSMIAEGAEVIDIGAESTGPHAMALSPEMEWTRLEPVLQALSAENFSLTPKISIDTYHAETTRKALNFKIDWINDVSASLQSVVAEHQCDYVFMHHLKIPEDRHYFLPLDQDPVKLIYQWAEEKIARSNIDPARLIFDIGIGFGKTAEQSLEVLQRIEEFKALGVKLLVGHSRKSFFQQFKTLPARERDIESVVTALNLNVDFLRVHNVEAHARAFRVFRSFGHNF